MPAREDPAETERFERAKADGELRVDAAASEPTVRMPAHWSPRPDDIPADVLAAIETGAIDQADGIRLGWRYGLAKGLGCEVTVEGGRVQVGDRPEPPAGTVGRCGERSPQFFPTVPSNHCALLAGHAGWHKGDDGAEWSRGPDLDDPLVVDLIGKAIVLAEVLRRPSAGEVPLTARESDFLAAVDAVLAARHNLRDQPPAVDLDTLLERGESACLEHGAVWPECADRHTDGTGPADGPAASPEPERAESVPQDTPDRPEGSSRSSWQDAAIKASLDAGKYLRQLGELAEALARRGITHDGYPGEAAIREIDQLRGRLSPVDPGVAAEPVAAPDGDFRDFSETVPGLDWHGLRSTIGHAIADRLRKAWPTLADETDAFWEQAGAEAASAALGVPLLAQIVARTEPPVTPPADLADEAAYERAASALLSRRLRPGFTVDEARAARVEAYEDAKAAIDACRAISPNPTEHVAYGAIADLANGLRNRWTGDLDHDTTDPQAIVSAALACIDRLATALGEAARDAHETVELEAAWDDGLTTDQEIRARALDAAVRFDSLTAEQVAQNAARFEAYIRDGDGATHAPTDRSQA